MYLSPSHTHSCKSVQGERESGVTWCKKTLRRPGLRPWPRWGSLQRSPGPLVGIIVSWLRSLPQNPILALDASGLVASPVPTHSKISSDAAGYHSFGIIEISLESLQSLDNRPTCYRIVWVLGPSRRARCQSTILDTMHSCPVSLTNDVTLTRIVAVKSEKAS